MSNFARTVFLGHDLALFLPHPNWRRTVDIAHRMAVGIDASRTGAEERTPEHDEMRLLLTATFTLDAPDAHAMEEAHWELGTAYVGVPLFPSALPVANWDERVYDAEYVINFGDDGSYALYALAEVPSEPEFGYLAPLLVGRLVKRPSVRWLTRDIAQFELQLTERSPWDFRVTERSVEVGTDWPAVLVENVRELPETEMDDMLEYRDLGAGRVEAVQGEEGAVHRTQHLLFTLATALEIRTLLSFYRARGGPWKSFVMPWAARPGADTEATPHETRVRFAQPELTLRFAHGSKADAKISFVQTPWEIDPVEGDEPEQAKRCFLYRYTLLSPTPVVWRFTNWGRTVTRAGDGDYLAAVLEHDTITQTTDLMDPATEIFSWMGSTNPVMRYFKRKGEVALTVEIFEADADDAAGAVLVHVGDIVDPKSRGKLITAPTTLFGGALDVKVPNLMIGPECGFELCGAGCNRADSMPPEDWTFGGTVTALAANEVSVLVTSNPPAAALVNDYFANGWIAKGDGETYEVRKIVRSEDLGAGVQKFVLKRAFSVLAGGTVVTARPYCNGTWTECLEKFGDNTVNFGGHRHIAETNLSLPKANTAVNSGKK